MSAFSTDKWSELKIADLYHPGYQRFLEWLMDATLGISFLLYGFTAYVILTKSPKHMEAFKYTVFTQLTFNMLYKVSMSIFNPVFHFPMTAISFTRSFSFSAGMVVPFFGSVFFTVVAAAIALQFSIFSRLLVAFHINSSKISVVNFRGGIFAYCGILILIWGSVMTPLIFTSVQYEPSWKSLEKTVPVLTELRTLLPNTFVLDPNLSGNFLTIFAGIAAFWIFIYAVVFITVNILFVLQLRKLKKIVSNSTYKLQKMLHTTLIIQTLNLLLFAGVPISLLIVVFVMQLPNGSWIGNLQFPISSLHLIADVPFLLYYVKPYRNFVIKLISRRKSGICKIERVSAIQKEVSKNILTNIDRGTAFL